MKRAAAALVAAALVAGCSATRTYEGAGADNVFVSPAIESGSRFSTMRGAIHVHEVDSACRTRYLGTVKLDRSSIAMGLPPERASYLVFSFEGSSFLGGSASSTTVGTLLKPRAGYRYEFAVTYQHSIYNVVLREADRKGSSRELSRRELAGCNA